MKSFTSLLLLAAATLSITAAAPSSSWKKPSPPKCSVHYILATYEDLTEVPGVGQVNTVTTYKGLSYTAFVGQQTGDSVPTIEVESPPKFVSTGPVQQTTSMSAASIQVAKVGDTFDLTGFYFGCLLTQLVTPCVVTIKGYDVKGRQVAVQEFNFTPDSLLMSKQTKAKVAHAKCKPSFSGLTKVEFSSDGVAKTIALDNLSYKLKEC